MKAACQVAEIRTVKIKIREIIQRIQIRTQIKMATKIKKIIRASPTNKVRLMTPEALIKVKFRKEVIMLLHHLPLRLLPPIQEELQNREFEAVKV